MFASTSPSGLGDLLWVCLKFELSKLVSRGDYCLAEGHGYAVEPAYLFEILKLCEVPFLEGFVCPLGNLLLRTLVLILILV